MSGNGNFVGFSQLKKRGMKERKGKVWLIDVAAQMQPFQLASMKSLLRNLLFNYSAHFYIVCVFLVFFGGTYLHPIYFLCWHVFLAPRTATNQSFGIASKVWKVSGSNVRPDRTPGELIIAWGLRESSAVRAASERKETHPVDSERKTQRS